MNKKSKKRFTEFLSKKHDELKKEYAILEIESDDKIERMNRIAEKLEILETVRNEWKKEIRTK